MASRRFKMVPFRHIHNENLACLEPSKCSDLLSKEAKHFDKSSYKYWGIPFDIPNEGNDILLAQADEKIEHQFLRSITGKYIVFMHAVDILPPGYSDDFVYPFKGMKDLDGFLSNDINKPYRGIPALKSRVCEYEILYGNGDKKSIPIDMRMNIGEWHNPMHQCFECVPHIKAPSFNTATEEVRMYGSTERELGFSLFRTDAAGTSGGPIMWLYAWKNPEPEKEIVGFRIIAPERAMIMGGITACNTSSHPLRWNTRRKLYLDFNNTIEGLDEQDREKILKEGMTLRNNISIDMGQVISVQQALKYPNENWESTRQNLSPEIQDNCYIIDYTAHDDAYIYLAGSKLNLQALSNQKGVKIKSPDIKTNIRILDSQTNLPIPVKLHIHGEKSEYLPPRNRERIPDSFWFEDYGADYLTEKHQCTYVDGEVEILLPKGKVYVEITKGFEYKPIKKILEIDETSYVLTIYLERSLKWRSKGWISADVHTHFISPSTAKLQGAAEDVNVVNLLATQWGEMFTNIGDFDGKTTFGSKENGGSGEYLVRVGTENRQKMLGHIILLGYEGPMILPLTTGIPDEGTLGSPVEQSLFGWARQAHNQNGLAILPHFTCPQAEPAAIVLGEIDGVEMVSWENAYAGINPFALADWYRYLNCGYHLPLVGGSDKMNANTALGTIRMYSLIGNQSFSYDSWKDSIKQGLTFVTNGPLINMNISGHAIGEKIFLEKGGNTLKVNWSLASITLPVTKIELIVNGYVKETKNFDSFIGETSGVFDLQIEKPSWIAIRIRGAYDDKPEMIAAHTSASMCIVDGVSFIDPVAIKTLIELIEAEITYIRTIAPRTEDNYYNTILKTFKTARKKLKEKIS